MIKAICVDLDGMFFTGESFQTFKENLAPHIEKEKRDFVLALSPQMKAYKAGELDEESYRNWAKQELLLTMSNEEIFQILRESYEVDEEVLTLIKDLREKEYKFCICSNNFPTRIRELDKKFSFLSLFEVQVFSYEVWALKPETKIFETLIEKADCQPEEILYADDKESNLVGAQELGIQTFVFTTPQDYRLHLKTLWI